MGSIFPIFCHKLTSGWLGDLGAVTCDLWPATCDRWPCDPWPVTCGPWPATCDLWPATRDLWPADSTRRTTHNIRTQSWLEAFHFKSSFPPPPPPPLSPPSPANSQDTCKSSLSPNRRDKVQKWQFHSPFKTLVNRGRGSVEMKNSITLRGLIYMVLGTRDNPFPEFPWPSLLLTYFFAKR